jgi:antirestriction protein ArdC
MSTRKPSVDWKQRVADEVARYIEAEDTLPWLRPWSVNGIFPMNMQTKHEYRGINALLLGMFMAVRGYQYPYFLTINGMNKMGGKFTDWDAAKEQGLPIVFWKMMRGEDRKTGEQKTFPLLKGWTVWNVAHMEGIELPERPPAVVIGGGIEGMESQYANPPKIQHEPSTQAYYSPLFDRITLPLIEQFTSEIGYGETKAHELIHSTGHSSRLARFDDKTNPHEAYAREELVAEIGAAIVLQRLGYEPEMQRMADYVKGWASRIKDDPNLLIGAANRADKAANMVLGIEQETAAADDDKEDAA